MNSIISFSDSYVSTSNCLKSIESNIFRLLSGYSHTKKVLCVELARIKKSRLYEELGISNFKQYLKAGRIKIKYSTAMEYSIIGEMLIKYNEELNEVGFDENDGLKKLLLLNAVEKNNIKSVNNVLSEIKKLSYRELKMFIKNQVLNDNRVGGIKEFTIKQDEERIFIEPGGVELVWLNPELYEESNSQIDFADFKSFLLRAIKDYFRGH